MRLALASLSLCALLSPSAARVPDDAKEIPEDVADVPSQDLHVGDEERMRYFLIGLDPDEEPRRGEKKKLLLVLPGGTGSADFEAFVRRIRKHALSDEWVVAQLVAPVWSEEQSKRLVWPTEKSPAAGMAFSTEEFLDAVLEDVEERVDVDPAFVFTLCWSSSGPAVYAWSVRKETRATGHFVSQSVFRPDEMPSLKGAKGLAYYLHQSPEDTRTPLHFAETAKEKLEKHGAEVRLVEYAGGHGWHGDVYGDLRAGIAWLERHHAKPRKKRRGRGR